MAELLGHAGARAIPGRVAVIAIRSLEDLEGGAGRYRVSWSSSVIDRSRHTRTVSGVDALEAEVGHWLAEIIAPTPPHVGGLHEVDDR